MGAHIRAEQSASPDAALSVAAPSQTRGQLPSGSPWLSPAYLRTGQWQHSPPALQGSDAQVGQGGRPSQTPSNSVHTASSAPEKDGSPRHQPWWFPEANGTALASGQEGAVGHRLLYLSPQEGQSPFLQEGPLP